MDLSGCWAKPADPFDGRLRPWHEKVVGIDRSRTCMIQIVGIDSAKIASRTESKGARWPGVQGMAPTCVLDTFRSKLLGDRGVILVVL